MPTPEEELAQIKAEKAELEAKLAAQGSNANDIVKKMEALEKDNKDRAERERVMTLDLAKRDAVAKYPKLKGFEDMVSGANKEEIETKAKTLAEKIEAREKEISGGTGGAAAAWNGVPRSVPSSLTITKDRQDEYTTVKQDKSLSLRAKTSKLMAMKMQDLHEKMIKGTRAALGI